MQCEDRGSSPLASIVLTQKGEQKMSNSSPVVRIVLGAEALAFLFEKYPEFVLEVSKGAFKDVIDREFGDMWKTEIREQVRSRLFKRFGDRWSKMVLTDEFKEFSAKIVGEIVSDSKDTIAANVREAAEKQTTAEELDKLIARHVEEYVRWNSNKRLVDAVDNSLDRLIESGDLQPWILKAIVDSGILRPSGPAD